MVYIEHMKKALIITSIVGIITVCGAVSYYLTVTVPQMNQRQLEQASQQNAEENKLKAQALRNECLKIKYGDTGNSATGNIPSYSAYAQSNLNCN